MRSSIYAALGCAALLISAASCAREGADGPVGDASSALTLYSPSQTPATTNASSGYEVELGMIFSADVDGTVDAVRFYKGTADTGAHEGHLWAMDGTLLSSVTFSGESASGWQEMAFTSPVAINSGTQYVISYHTATGFSLDISYFDSPVDNTPLHAPVGAGVYAFGTGPRFPNATYFNSGYSVDLQFTPGSSATTTLFDDTDAPGTEIASTIAYELGVKFTSDVTGTIQSVRFYKEPGDTSAHTAHVWNSAGAVLASAPFTGETASGWQEVAVFLPVAAGQTYTVSYSTSSNFGYDANYYSVGRDRSPLHAPAGGGVYGPSGVFPSNVFNNANYWVDLRFFASGTCVPSTCTACGIDDGCGTICCSGTAYSIWPSFEVPSGPGILQSVNYEVGTGFVPEVDGSITALRYYRIAGDGGSHTGHLWNAGGTLLATAAFTGTTPGWQQVSLSTAVGVSAGATYVTSYTTTTGFALTENYFTSTRNRPPLSVGVNGGVYGVGGAFPSNVYNASNYWADVVFAPGTVPPPSSSRLFSPSSTPTHPLAGEGTQYELGVQFTSDNDALVTSLLFYKGEGNTGTHVGHLWDALGGLLATETFTGETTSGWQEVTLSSPVAITAGTTYVASFNTTGGFSYDVGFFAPGYNRPPLHVPVNGGVYGLGTDFPTLVYSSSNYWVDVVTTPP